MANLRELLRKDVIVTAGGTTYTGTLIEATDEEVTLKTPAGWVSVQMSRITSIRGARESEQFAQNRFVDRSFYDPDVEY